ncbi:uncharacterized protein Proc-R isoform X1 [Diabrotica undecimpunctata]|uniref:uncharacterized protein Proc-R isoform X1 n=1 Tax=Diabrotica undecimpunctata TaxID=50387 RepID=UPI003B63785A
MDDDEALSQTILNNSRFWVQKVLVPTLLCLGVIGNTVTIMVLTRRRMRSSTNIYLSALAVADIIHLVFGFLLSFEHYHNIHDRKYELYWRFYGLTHWFCDAASATSAWLAVSFTIERFIAVRYPMKGKIFCTERRAKGIIAIVYVFCFVTTASTTFEYQLTFNDICVKQCPIDQLNYTESPHLESTSVGNITYVESEVNSLDADANIGSVVIKGYDKYIQKKLKQILSNCTNHPHIILVPVYPNVLNSTTSVDTINRSLETDLSQVLETNSNSTIATGGHHVRSLEESENRTYCCEKNFPIDVENTELGKNKTYTDFIYWYSALFFAIIPLLLIAMFNCFLIRVVYSSQKTRRVMTNSHESSSWTNEKRITIMLIGIVFAFLICQIPTAIHIIYYHFNEPKNKVQVNIRLILGNFCNFMVMLMAPCNFLIYCLLSKKFRTTFKKIFWQRFRAKQIEADTILRSSTKGNDTSAKEKGNKFNTYKDGLMKKMTSKYRTPRNLETHSLTSMPRSKPAVMRPIGKAKSCDLNV